jgi:hypothetical protein
MDLRRGVKPGKFEKLLRSDPECLVWVVPGVSVV